MRRGFTLVEIMVVLAVVGVLTALTVYAIGGVSRTTRLSGAGFTVVGSFAQAKQRAIAQGTDVYLIFNNLDSTDPNVIIYQDNALALRAPAAAADIMSVVNANPDNVRERLLTGGTGQFGYTGLAFITSPGSGKMPGPNLTSYPLPSYLSVSSARRTDQQCSRTFCTFCVSQNSSSCIGAVRFDSRGNATIVTGSAGSGGLVRLVNPANSKQGTTLAISEPSGIATPLLRE